jgi:hypothetical protein
MRAAWYEKQGPAKEVLVVDEMPDPHPAAGEVRVRISASGINPDDIKKRQDSFSRIRGSSRITTAPGAWIRSATALLPNGSAGRYGATAPSRIARSGRLRNLPSRRWIMWLTSRERVAGPRRLPWDTGYHGPPRRSCRGRSGRAHRLGPRGRRLCRNVRGTTRASCRSACNRHGAIVR